MTNTEIIKLLQKVRNEIDAAAFEHLKHNAAHQAATGEKTNLECFNEVSFQCLKQIKKLQPKKPKTNGKL